MNKKKHRIRWITLLLVLVLAAVAPTTAFAAGYDGGRAGSITVQLQDLETPMDRVVFRCYRVADVLSGASLRWQTVSALEAYSMDFNGLKTARDYQEAANFLEGVVEEAGLTPLEAETDASGQAVFTGLAHGVYLLVQADTAAYGVVDAFLVSLPYVDDAASSWTYDVRTEPKGEHLPETPTPTPPPTNVQTGDTTHTTGYLMAALLSAGMLAVLCAVKIKGRKRTEK